jgi:hypothetical protein
MRTLLLLVACIIFICSCGKVECPAFPEELMTWVDYKKTDTLRYKSFNDTLSHIVINNHKSERYSFNKNLDCVCGASAGFVSDINKNGYNIIGSCFYSDDLIDVSYRFQTSEIEDLFEFRYDLSNNQLLDDLTIINYELNGVVLSNVLMLENTQINIVGKVYFTSQKGLIAFVDNNSTEWKLIE